MAIKEQLKDETKKVKAKVIKSFYYAGTIQKSGTIIEMHLRDAKQWPSKVQIIDTSVSAGAAIPESKPESDPKKQKEEKGK